MPAVVPGFDAAGKFLQGLGNLARPGLPSGTPSLASAGASMTIPATSPGRKPVEEFPPRVPEEWLMQKNGVASAPSGGDK